MKVKHLLVMVCVAAAFSIAANTKKLANDLIGTWKYTVSDVPPEYETGSMTFEQTGDKLTGFMEVNNGKSEMKELKVDQDKVVFKLDFQGGLISFDFTQKGEKLEGVVVTQDGQFPIVAVKEKKN